MHAGVFVTQQELLPLFLDRTCRLVPLNFALFIDFIELSEALNRFPWRHNPSRPGPPQYRGSTITLGKTHNNRQDSSRRVISPTQRPVPDNTQHSLQTSIPSTGFEPPIPSAELPQTHA